MGWAEMGRSLRITEPQNGWVGRIPKDHRAMGWVGKVLKDHSAREWVELAC